MTFSTNTLILLCIYLVGICATTLNLEDIQKRLSSSENGIAIKNFETCGSVHDKYDYCTIHGYFINQFINNSYSSYIGQEPVFIYDLDLQSAQFGNRLGNYYEAVAFAHHAGMHFVGFQHHAESHHHNVTEAFTSKLKKIIYHLNPKSRADVLKYLSTEEGQRCKNPWPWTQRNRLWMQNMTYIRESIRDGISNYLALTYGADKKPSDIKVSASSFVNGTHGEEMNLIPNTVILLRCGDILHHGGHDYGFLHFKTYDELIPMDSKEVYIVSEPLKYGPHMELCKGLCDTIVSYIKSIRPETRVYLRRGHAFDSFSMFGSSSNVICTPSTFCFFGSLGNFVGQVHYKSSELANEGDLKPVYEGISNLHSIEKPPLLGFWKNTYDANKPGTLDFIVGKLTSPLDTLPSDPVWRK